MVTDRGNRAADRGGGPGEEEHRAHYDEFFEFASDGLLLTDSHGVIVRGNQAAAALLRCPKEFLSGKPLGLFVVVGGRRRFYECLALLHGGAGWDEFEAQVARRDEPRQVIFRVSPAGRAEGPPLTFRWLLRDVTARRKAEATRDDLLRRLVTAQEDERRRVARELHDSVGQLQTALLLGLRAIRDAGPLPPATLGRLDEVQQVAEELGRATHDLAVRLRPTALDDVGLHAALQHYLEDWSARTGVEVEFQAAGLKARGGRFPPEVETVLYRVVQEALTNVSRHAGARRVGVVLERQDGCAIAVVEDNGVGFDPEAAVASGRLGLVGMRERLALLGGSLDVESSPGAGTTVIARVPLAVPGVNNNGGGRC